MAKKSPKRLLQLKADKAMQEWGRRTYKKCMVCGGKYNCLHHYVTKGRSAALRYDEKNLIPICQSCHFLHHTSSDPAIHNTINDIKGKAWRDDLQRRRSDYTKTNMDYYKDIIEKYATKTNS